MKFRTELCRSEFKTRQRELLQICSEFEYLSEAIGIEPVVTRVMEKIEGSSGVHEAGRAVDFRDEYALGKFLYEPQERINIAQRLNAKYARRDGKPTCMWHSFQGGPLHAHIQLAWSLDVYEGGSALWKSLDS